MTSNQKWENLMMLGLGESRLQGCLCTLGGGNSESLLPSVPWIEGGKQSAEVYLRLLGGIAISNRFEVVSSPFPGVCKREGHISRGL